MRALDSEAGSVGEGSLSNFEHSALLREKMANGMERGQNHKKETPTEIGASRYCWQLALNTDPPVTKRCEDWSGQQQR
jgi:hypothetical protein